MKIINPMDLTEQENYFFLTGSVIPRPVAFTTTLSRDGVLNAAPFSYFNIVTANPPMLSISVQRDRGVMKDTARNAKETGDFVIHITDESYIEKINETSIAFPPTRSEVEYTGLTPVDSSKIKTPGVKEAGIRMECVVEKIIPLGGRESAPACDLVIGRVVKYHIREGIIKDGRIDPRALRPVSRLAGTSYEKLGEIFKLERP
ncbi:flavin reductase family protein [Isachenkonia alkalipeptolytica]|uniref:Flavin reductase family protein n=2 Tax=Isachenkonia alkalipeptolytica TaxID=2565777 RepID=A0AA44BDR3_9CLOT|nr:flavin reductase family protein [Isachenkonia alkalipeptolytica]